MRGKKAPLLRGALAGLGLGLQDNIIIHSVNNILILLSMINSVNVKNNRIICGSLSWYVYYTHIIPGVGKGRLQKL
jgi:hypothetical protein